MHALMPSGPECTYEVAPMSEPGGAPQPQLWTTGALLAVRPQVVGLQPQATLCSQFLHLEPRLQCRQAVGGKRLSVKLCLSFTFFFRTARPTLGFVWWLVVVGSFFFF